MEPPRSIWLVVVAYLAAVVGIVALSGVAMLAVIGLYPDVPEQVLLRSPPALVAGSLAAAAALAITVAAMARPLDATRLRLRPGWESGRDLLVMVVAMLTLGQSLDSLTTVLGLGDSGTLPVLREALAGAVGPELFLVVLSVGVVGPAAEEVFFRGYLQSELRRRWPAWAAVIATSAGFAVLHVDPTGVHVALALVLGLYLGFVVELTGSTLPAVVCHVVNNVVFTLQTAAGAGVGDRATHGWVAAAAATVFVACLLWLRRARPAGAP